MTRMYVLKQLVYTTIFSGLCITLMYAHEYYQQSQRYETTYHQRYGQRSHQSQIKVSGWLAIIPFIKDVWDWLTKKKKNVQVDVIQNVPEQRYGYVGHPDAMLMRDEDDMIQSLPIESAPVQNARYIAPIMQREGIVPAQPEVIPPAQSHVQVPHDQSFKKRYMLNILRRSYGKHARSSKQTRKNSDNNTPASSEDPEEDDDDHDLLKVIKHVIEREVDDTVLAVRKPLLVVIWRMQRHGRKY